MTILTTQELATYGYFITPLVAAATLVVGSCEVLILPITLRNETAVLGWIWISCATLNFGLNLILIPYLGIIDVALTTFLAFLLAFSLIALYSFRHFAFDINVRFMVKSALASIAMSLLLVLWNPTGILNLLVSISLAAVLLGILLILKGLTVREIKFFFSMLSSLWPMSIWDACIIAK